MHEVGTSGQGNAAFLANNEIKKKYMAQNQRIDTKGAEQNNLINII